MKYTVGDLVKDRYANIPSIVVKVCDNGMLATKSIIISDWSHIKYYHANALIPYGEPFLNSVVNTEYGYGTVVYRNGPKITVLSDDDFTLKLRRGDCVLNIYDNEFLDNRYLDILLDRLIHAT